jgi:hypothetical protein
MNGNVIKSFLVGLGFNVDDSSLKKFNEALAKASLKVVALYTATKALSAGIVYSIAKISEGFEQMGYEYRIIAPAINKALVLRRELLKAYSAAGINITKVVVASVKLNMSLAKTKFALDAIYKSVGSRFFGLITKQSDLFRQKIYANMPKIQNALEKFVKFTFKALEATVTLGTRLWSILTRVYDFFVMLDKATNGWSTIILGVVAAWKLLNLTFLATPLGMLLTGLVSILALYDDFKTFEEGGKSLFDWTPFLPVIDAVSAHLTTLANILRAIMDVIGNIILAFYNLFKLGYRDFFQGLADAAASMTEVFKRLWESIKSVGNVLGAVGGFASNVLGLDTTNAAANLKNNPTAQPLSQPLGASNVPNSPLNQNVNQQTSINIMGSADANATGKAVASEQGKVNFDLFRNMKGATR